MTNVRLRILVLPLLIVAIGLSCSACYRATTFNTTRLSLFDDAISRDDALTVLEYLNDGGDPSVCITPNAGTTALHLAAALGSTNVISVLLAHGANREMWDDLGAIPIKYAVEYGHTNAAIMLSRPEEMQNSESATKEVLECVMMRICGDKLRALKSEQERLTISVLLEGKPLSGHLSTDISRRFDVMLTGSNMDAGDNNTQMSLRIFLRWRDSREVTAYVRGASFILEARIVRRFGYWIVADEIGGES